MVIVSGRGKNTHTIPITPPKFNMEPENQSLGEEIPLGHHHFQVFMMNFGGLDPRLTSAGRFPNRFLIFSSCWLPICQKKGD